ncbi:unnamed protein product [Phyllotreta striolata]|uniref:Uncharacterized protein n=1 Tax=Phyllotreta striolata TaxID=444603 RepID=A0A9P0GVZ9_PHYSR|nr:unnamed protein product [Phyllotreta striolata]
MAANPENAAGSNGTLSRHFPAREYDALKQQIEKTTNELTTSRRRCDHALSDLDYYREQHRAVMNQLEISSQDSSTLRTKYSELLVEHKQLQSEHQALREALSKVESSQDDNARLMKERDELNRDRSQAQREVANLRQQLVKLCKDYAKYREAHQKLQQQYDEAVNLTIKANKDIKRLTDERNATMAEYTLVMSERDTVHKEMEKLSDDLAQSIKKCKLLDLSNKELQDEKRHLSYRLESLRREIASALHERDKAVKECNDLREKFGDTSFDNLLAGCDQTTKKAREGPGGQPGDATRGVERMRGDEDEGMVERRQRLDNLDQANQELENLRKCLDKVQGELAEAVQEAEVSKGRRDWAFAERDKIVLERESIRSLCDSMRKERDRAVSALADALRDLDALRSLRDELVEQSKALRDALELQPQPLDRQTGEYSRTDVVELELTPGDEEAVELAGEPSGVYVASVVAGSTAEGRIFRDDRILKVNDIDCSQGSLRMVTEAIRSSMPLARLLVKRSRSIRSGGGGGGGGGDQERVTKWIHTARLVPGCHGVSLKAGVFIHRISEGSLAARDGSLTVGDRVLRINDKSMDDAESLHEAISILNDDTTDVVNITTLKMSYPECPNVFTPVRRYKKENRSSQTEDWPARDSKYPTQEKNNSINNNTNNNSNNNNTNNNGNGGAWLKEKFDMMRGPWRHSKEEKKKYRNSSPNPVDFGHEQAIAELDLVIDSYRPGTLKKSGAAKKHFAQAKEDKSNGGTWPKARATPVLAPDGGTVVTRAKQRPPLSLLAPKTSDSYNYRNSTPAPLAPSASPSSASVRPVYSRHSVYKSVDNSRHFGADAGDSFERLKIADGANSRLGSNVNSDNSLDFPVHRYVDKEMLSYYKKPTRSALSKYGSDSERDHHHHHHHQYQQQQLQQQQQQQQNQSRFHAPYPTHSDRSRDSFSFSFEPFHHHAHSPSADVAAGASRRRPDVVESGGTFPRKNQRFRVPSNPSVTSKVSTGSIERGGGGGCSGGGGSERGSPMPIFHVEVLSSPGDHSTAFARPAAAAAAASAASNPKDFCPWAHKPLPGELRRVHIDKSNEPLGIQINCPQTGGIFVSTVNENSLASRVGLQIGDQLLEVCGINMRNATYNLAANVLRQCGNSITMLVQYSPDKYRELGVDRSGTDSESDDDDEDEDDDDDEEDETEEATPCNSPKEIRKSSSMQLQMQMQMQLQLQQPSLHPQRQSPNIITTNSRSSSEDPRYLCIETLKTSNLGISLVGGNAAGIFIHSVQPDSLAYHAGLRTGDQILEYNGSDLRAATAEEAAYELAKPADKVSVLAHYRIDKYNEIKDKPGDSLYVRCGFDRAGDDATEPPELSFAKDEVIYVDNTMFNGAPGKWRAWKLDGEGRRQQCGVVPSKYKVEEELLLRRGAAGGGDSIENRSTATARRSFFRRKKYQRSGSGNSGLNTSRDSKELASFCNLSPGWYSDSVGSLHEDLSHSSYQRVERLQRPDYRPVIVLGPLAECVADKLVQDFPDTFGRAATETRGRCAQALLDRELAEGATLDYRRRGSCYECLTVSAVRSVSQNRLHCMLDGSIAMVQRLHRHRLYPVVLLVKFKGAKQIREARDGRHGVDKLSGKAAKEMFEHGRKLELEYRHLVSAVVAAGANVAHICAQVKAAVDAEHRKSQWIPTGNLH